MLRRVTRNWFSSYSYKWTFNCDLIAFNNLISREKSIIFCDKAIIFIATDLLLKRSYHLTFIVTHPWVLLKASNMSRLRVLNYDDLKLFIIRKIDKLTECWRLRNKKWEKTKLKNLFTFFVRSRHIYTHIALLASERKKKSLKILVLTLIEYFFLSLIFLISIIISACSHLNVRNFTKSSAFCWLPFHLQKSA